MIKNIAHVCIAAMDLAATERFYCSGLGCKKVFDFVRKKEVIGFYLEVSPGSYVEVFRQTEVNTQAKSPISHLCFEVDSLDLTMNRLVSHGYSVTEKKLGADRSWQSWTTDPGGVRIEFHEYTPHSSQVTGENCLLD